MRPMPMFEAWAPCSIAFLAYRGRPGRESAALEAAERHRRIREMAEGVRAKAAVP
jgi:hypothetical protein